MPPRFGQREKDEDGEERSHPGSIQSTVAPPPDCTHARVWRSSGSRGSRPRERVNGRRLRHANVSALEGARPAKPETGRRNTRSAKSTLTLPAFPRAADRRGSEAVTLYGGVQKRFRSRRSALAWSNSVGRCLICGLVISAASPSRSSISSVTNGVKKPLNWPLAEKRTRFAFALL